MPLSTLNFEKGNRKEGKRLEQWVLKGKKTSTSQVHEYGKKGDIFLIQGVKFRIISVKRMTLKQTFQKNYKKEGCKTPKEFEKIWMKFHKYQDEWPLNTRVYVYSFKRT